MTSTPADPAGAVAAAATPPVAAPTAAPASPTAAAPNAAPANPTAAAPTATEGPGSAKTATPTPSGTEPILVLSTCPNEDTASRIARDLVESGLVACVNRLSGVRSTYRWQERVEDEPEVLLLIKTVRARYPELEVRLKSLHPYEVPEIIALPILTGSAAYLAWLSGSVQFPESGPMERSPG